jgi:hypothetical protein
MLALCRLLGLPARYVSGHLVGEGGTHAWVEVLEPVPGDAIEILAWDPTHDRPADLRYLTVAVGPDYRDVAPVSGTYRGAHGVAIRHPPRERGPSRARNRRLTLIANRESMGSSPGRPLRSRRSRGARRHPEARWGPTQFFQSERLERATRLWPAAQEALAERSSCIRGVSPRETTDRPNASTAAAPLSHRCRWRDCALGI